ncbi:Putative SOS response-associated peptidase YedK [Devosia sp. YR412]|uniref:SOS response-associated peptidase n=1 Tax=Devosia sp. YR412 TaxID=1881030 RepID=UPI0008C9C71F|nr:SOS response-associated peptidase [Devosia sp. YR412]SEP83142.1 Putative SOS response-associated peptidase YedK [Devosia sp. YR412]
MCGRYASTLPPELMVELFKLLKSIDMVPRYNIAPTQPIAAIWEAHGRREAHFARWGLVPGWVKDPRDFPLLVNARVETMAEKPAFRDGLKHGRCIVPASGYYEWHTNPDKSKQPYYITMQDGAPMALAGVYASWMGPNGEEIDSVATITVPANEQLSAIHHRMPAILRGDEIDAWLNVREVRAAEAAQLAIPLENGAVKFHPVSTRVNSARDDDAGLIEPAELVKPEPKLKKAAGGQMSLF